MGRLGLERVEGENDSRASWKASSSEEDVGAVRGKCEGVVVVIWGFGGWGR